MLNNVLGKVGNETVLGDISTDLRMKRYRSAWFVVTQLRVRYSLVPFSTTVWVQSWSEYRYASLIYGDTFWEMRR